MITLFGDTLEAVSGMKSAETTKQPSDVIIMRGLSSGITEKSIMEEIEKLGHFPEYVRIIKDRTTGISKGIAIIKFKSIEHSKNFLETNSTLEIEGSAVWIDYGFEHSSDDWTCKYCQNINFNHRDACFKCSKLKLPAFPDRNGNFGNDDISNSPTRFLLIRNLESGMTPQKIFDKIFLFECNLKRVWVLVDTNTRKSKEFAFLEFNSVEFATDFLNRQALVGIPLKIESNELILSYGRDLSLLSQSLSGTLIGKIIYWDNNYEFFEYPPYIISVPETSFKNDDSILGIKSKRTAFGALPALSHKVPPKKIQLQLKTWTEKANSSQNLNDTNMSSNFVAEESARKSKSKFIDITFLCCLLCNIKFNTEEELLNHAQNSGEHAQKFENYWKQSISEQKESECYLDRAAERRDAFGVNEEELRKIAQDRQDSLNSRPTIKTGPPQGASEESIGAKLMKKMGWKEGSGLGKDSDGIVEAIKAKTLENSNAGIGAANLITADEIRPKSYNDIVRSGRKKRYNE